MSNRFNGGRGAITCDSDEHSGRMIAEGVPFAQEPPYLPAGRPKKVYHLGAVWAVDDDGQTAHYCSAECANKRYRFWPLFGGGEEPRS